MLQPPEGAHAVLEEVAADLAAVAAGRLQAPCAAFFMPAEISCRGVVIMLHGFTAGPWQFNELAPALAAAGLHVYAARLPGHGGCTQGHEDPTGLPRAAAAENYGIGADRVFVQARTLAHTAAVPLFIFGFSLGGAMGLDLALRYPQQVQRLVLAAPLLRPQGAGPQRLFAILHALRFLGAPYIMDRIRFSWGPLPEPPPGGWLRPGHWFFRLGHLYAALHYANAVAGRAAAGVHMPTQVILTANDPRCDARSALAVLKSSPTPERAWMFPKESGVPHAMLTAGENPDTASRARIHKLTLEFLCARGSPSPAQIS